MKRSLILLFNIIIVIFSIQSSIQAETPFSFRLNVGFGMISSGDFNAFVDSQNALFEDTVRLLNLTKEGKFKKINWGPDLEGEIIFHLNHNLGVGLSAGYILRKKTSKTTLKYESIYYNLTEFKPEISVIPLKLSAHYFRRIFSKTRLFVCGGVGLYFGKMSYSMVMDETILGFNHIVKTSGEVTATGIGFHGGIGLEYAVKKNIFVFFEGTGRYANLKNWEGEEMLSGSAGEREMRSGTLWYYESLDEDLGKHYSNLRLSKEKPVGSQLQNVREFANDLSGVSFSAGIRIRF